MKTIQPDEGKTDEQLMRDAFQALLRGDTAERDRLVSIIERRNEAREREAIKLAQAAAPYFPKELEELRNARRNKRCGAAIGGGNQGDGGTD